MRGDVYHNVVESLSSVPVAMIYIAANIALAIHIYHGAWSMFQSLGVNNPYINKARRPFAAGFATIILIGNLSFPIAAMTGLLDTLTKPAHPTGGVAFSPLSPLGRGEKRPVPQKPTRPLRSAPRSLIP